MAKALYDNVPESPEELAFRKGDILSVIEQNTGGLEGWWLCSLHGRQGIAPGNRLKLLIGPMFEAQPSSGGAAPQQTSGGGVPQGLYQVPPSLQSPQQSLYQLPLAQDVYQVPPRSHLAADSPASKVRSQSALTASCFCFRLSASCFCFLLPSSCSLLPSSCSCFLLPPSASCFC